MGVLLSKPNTDKEYDEGQNDKLAFAACSMQVGSCAFKRAHTFRNARTPSASATQPSQRRPGQRLV